MFACMFMIELHLYEIVVLLFSVQNHNSNSICCGISFSTSFNTMSSSHVEENLIRWINISVFSFYLLSLSS